MLKDFFLEFLKPRSFDSPVSELNLFYVIDVSGSMSGNKIQAVNSVMPEVMEMVNKISEENADNAVIKASVLKFNEYAEWLFPMPIYASEMSSKWPALNANGKTSFGLMCDALEKALHRNISKNPCAQLNSIVGHKAPAIILISDGHPLDDDWEFHLDLLKGNEWFNESSKIAIAIGNDCNRSVLSKFVGEGAEEKIYTVHNIKDLKRAIKIVSSVASIMGSKTAKPMRRDIAKHLFPIVNPDGIEIDDFD